MEKVLIVSPSDMVMGYEQAAVFVNDICEQISRKLLRQQPNQPEYIVNALVDDNKISEPTIQLIVQRFQEAGWTVHFISQTKSSISEQSFLTFKFTR